MTCFREAGSHLPRERLVDIRRLRRESLFPEGRIAMKIAAAAGDWGWSRRCGCPVRRRPTKDECFVILRGTVRSAITTTRPYN